MQGKWGPWTLPTPLGCQAWLAPQAGEWRGDPWDVTESGVGGSLLGAGREMPAVPSLGSAPARPALQICPKLRGSGETREQPAGEERGRRSRSDDTGVCLSVRGHA